MALEYTDEEYAEVTKNREQELKELFGAATGEVVATDEW